MRGLFSFLLAVVVAGCGNDNPETYMAEAGVKGFDISVEVSSLHPTLNEYSKHVEVRRDAIALASFTLSDPGGFTPVYVVDDGERLLIVDGLVNGKAIDKKSGMTTEVNAASIPKDFPERSLGQFRFVDSPEGYTWVRQGQLAI